MDQDKVLKVYERIAEYKLSHHGIAPTVQDLMDITGFRSAKSVHDYLVALENVGLITRVYRSPRSIKIMGEVWTYSRPPTTGEVMDTLHGTTLKVYAYIVGCVVEGKDHPSYDEIKDVLGLASKSTVGWHLKRLRDAGFVRQDKLAHRSLILEGAEYDIDESEVPGIGKPHIARAKAAIEVESTLREVASVTS